MNTNVKHKQILYILVITAAVLFSSVTSASACSFLNNITSAEALDIPFAELLKCIERGGDPPPQFRPQGGARPVSSDGVRTVNFCGTSLYQGCPSNSGKLTPPTLPLPPITLPKVEELPWGELESAQIPCGAVANLSQMVLQAIFGNINFNPTVPLIGGDLDDALQLALKTFGEHMDCSDGTFWNILNAVINLIIPGGAPFEFSVTNSSFLSPAGSIIAFDSDAGLEIDLTSQGATFDLPAGGSFIDSAGQKIEIAADDVVTFSTSGHVTTQSGNSYFVNPRNVVSFKPNGMIRLQEQFWLPAEGTLMPAGAKSQPPEWAKKK